MLEPNERQKLKEIIQQQIESAETDIIELVEVTRPVAPDNSIGRISRMDAINNKSVNDAALRQTRKKLERLNRALDEIDKKSFGICIRCGNPIAYGRLEFMPESKKCVKCS
ncbi:MAG: TraR/DksA C4-type zinc finger protein [Balneolales bacterium]